MDVDINRITQSDYLLKLGINQCAAGDFPDAIRSLKRAGTQFLKEKKYKYYLQCQNFLIVMHTEMENFDEINRIRYELAEVIWNHKQLGTNYARFHYSLGFCFLRQQDHIKAQVQLDQALAQTIQLKTKSMEQQDQKSLLISEIDTCYVAYGFACLYSVNNQILEAIQELNNMSASIDRFKKLHARLTNSKAGVLTESAEDEDQDIVAILAHSIEEQKTLEFAYNLLKASLLRLEKKYDSAEGLYWLCYEQSQKSYRRKYMSLHLLYFLGKNYMEKKDYEQASIFLNLAKKSVNPVVFKKIHRLIICALEDLKEAMTNNYDIVVSFENKMIVEKQKGHVNIKNQFILMDMLKLFISSPGTVYSKESLVEKVWRQKYDPSIHDNKIYVTIKRLRELVEPDHKKPKYIFRTKNGYYINKNVKILLK